jgi:hypothetical protein
MITPNLSVFIGDVFCLAGLFLTTKLKSCVVYWLILRLENKISLIDK